MAASVAYQGMDDNTRMPPPNMDYHNTTYNMPGHSRVRQSALLDIVQAKKVHVYRNNEEHFECKEIVVNPKNCPDMDHLMDIVTEKIGAPSAVRYIFTPINGTRVTSLGDIKQNQRLVAASKNRFRRIDYSKAGIKTTIPPRKHYERRAPKTLPNIQARLYNQRAEALSIIVYQSGYQYKHQKPKHIQLGPRIRHNWFQILDEITRKLKDTFGLAVLKLYTIDKTREITEPSELENGARYIAVGPGGLRRNVQYDIVETPNRPLQYGHKAQKHSRNEESTYAKMYNDKVTADKSKATSRRHPDINRSKQRQRPRQESETFPNKPVKHKRDVRAAGTSKQQPHAPLTEKDDKTRGSVYRSGRVKPHDAAAHAPDADDRGVYKSKHGNVQAAEVQEDEDTHVDLPIDQIPAETVEAEEILDVSAEQTDHEEIPRESRDSPMHTQRSIHEDLANDIKEVQKSPPRTPTSPTRHTDDDFLPAHEPVAETTMKSNSMSNEAQENVEPQKTFKSNSMKAQHEQDDEDDRITFEKLDSVKDEEPVHQEEIPQDLPLLTEAGKDEVATSQEVEPSKPEANNDGALTDEEEAEKTITEEINESSKENISSSINDDQEDAQHTTEEALSDAKDYETTEPGEGDKQSSSLHVEEDDKLEDGQEIERQPSPVVENERQTSPAPENERQPSPVAENEQQPNPVAENERQPTPVVDNERQPSPALEIEGQPGPVVENQRQPSPTGEMTDDLRRPDGAYDTSNDKIDDERSEPLQEEITEDTARPDTSTPVMANGNGAISASNENQKKELAQNEAAVNEVNVSS